MAGARLDDFRCWWCGRRRVHRNLHHQVTGADGSRRACCVYCYHDAHGSYRRCYDGETQERAEIERVRGVVEPSA